MLNYLRAEFYKVFRRKYFWVLLAAMLALETLFVLLLGTANDFAYLSGAMAATMPVGSYLAVLLADMVVSDPYKTGTMKNELAFGLSRSRIYLGKLAAAAAVALLFCGILFGWYLGGCWLFSSLGDPEAVRTNLGILAFVAAASLPLWLSVLSFSTALYLCLRNEFAGAVIAFLSLTLGVGVLTMLALMKLGPITKLAELLLRVMPSVQFDLYSGELTWGLMAKNWAIGLGWSAVSTAAGLAVFKRREVR